MKNETIDNKPVYILEGFDANKPTKILKYSLEHKAYLLEYSNPYAKNEDELWDMYKESIYNEETKEPK